MIHVLMKDGKVRDYPKAVSASLDGTDIICVDANGQIIAVFPCEDVSAYGEHQAFADFTAPPQPAIIDEEPAEQPWSLDRTAGPNC